MRKIEKDLSNAPKSLEDKIKELIRNGDYQKINFKKNIQKSLRRVYKNKCAYCEERISYSQSKNIKEKKGHSIEHYRPKSKYYWLAYSWDNLLWCCEECNQNKDDEFEIENEKVEYSTDFDSKIHCSTEEYNRLERPKMIHPELENVMDKLIFDEKGKIYSSDNRVQYSIDCCKLDRDYLNTKRKKVFDDFIKKIHSAIADRKNKWLQDNIEKIVLDFKNDSENLNNEFIAFRVWVIEMLKNSYSYKIDFPTWEHYQYFITNVSKYSTLQTLLECETKEDVSEELIDEIKTKIISKEYDIMLSITHIWILFKIDIDICELLELIMNIYSCNEVIDELSKYRLNKIFSQELNCLSFKIKIKLISRKLIYHPVI